MIASRESQTAIRKRYENRSKIRVILVITFELQLIDRFYATRLYFITVVILSKLLVIKRHGKKETKKTQDRRQTQ
jgi:hypothetical protein